MAVIAAVAATGWWLAASRPHEVPVSSVPVSSVPVSSGSGTQPVPAGASAAAPTGSTAASTAASASPPGSSASIVVDVAGKVHRPGVYTLPPGARVDDAVRAAGGALRGVSTVSLNLAAPLHDGQQVVVGLAGTPPATDPGAADGGTGGSASATGSSTVVDLNSATLEQLETLPGVGPVLGQHILDWRDAHGRFTGVDQLREVSGIGDVRFAQLRPLVSV